MVSVSALKEVFFTESPEPKVLDERNNNCMVSLSYADLSLCLTEKERVLLDIEKP